MIDKIQERGYVSKKNITGKEIECEDYLLDDTNPLTIQIIKSKREFGNETNKLVIEPLGIIVIEFLLTHFDNFFTDEAHTNMSKVSKTHHLSPFYLTNAQRSYEIPCG